MCAPLVIAGAALATSIVGTGLQVAGTIQAGKAQKAEADANAMLAKSAAVEELIDSRDELFKHGIEARRQIGTQEAIAAAANLDLTFGSARGVLSDRYRFAAMESITIGTNAARRSLALRNSAAAYESYGRNAVTGSRLGAAGVAIGGVGQAISAAGTGYRLGQSFSRPASTTNVGPFRSGYRF